MIKIGTSLVDPTTGQEIMHWDALPRTFTTPKGEVRTGAIEGAQVDGKFLLVGRFANGPPSPFATVTGEGQIAYDGSDPENLRVVVERFYQDNPPPPPTPIEVNIERDRRIGNGFTFNGVVFQSRADDQQNISGAGILAFMAVAAGSPPGNLRWHGGTSDFAWIAADNSLVPMDAQTVVAFGRAAAAHKTLHIFAARTLKDLSPIPYNFTDDEFWPPHPKE